MRKLFAVLVLALAGLVATPAVVSAIDPGECEIPTVTGLDNGNIRLKWHGTLAECVSHWWDTLNYYLNLSPVDYEVRSYEYRPDTNMSILVLHPL